MLRMADNVGAVTLITLGVGDVDKITLGVDDVDSVGVYSCSNALKWTVRFRERNA